MDLNREGNWVSWCEGPNASIHACHWDNEGDICPGLVLIVSSHRNAAEEFPEATNESKITACVEAVISRSH